MSRQHRSQQDHGPFYASDATLSFTTNREEPVMRTALESGDGDEAARVRRAFGGLGLSGIERLASKELVRKFNEVNGKRNRWLGHSGFMSERVLETQIDSLTDDLRELRGIFGSVWTQLPLVRAGRASRGRDGLIQSAEVAMATRSPFSSRDFRVGELMFEGELYLVQDDAQSPLHLGGFVQLRQAPSSALYTTYFYNRTEGERVHMVSFQHGSEDHVQDQLASLRGDFGGLLES